MYQLIQEGETHQTAKQRQHVFLQNSVVGISSNIAAVVALIRYAMCLTTAKFTDRVNVEITLKKKIYWATKAILHYGTLGIPLAGMNW